MTAIRELFSASYAASITPSDSVDFANVTRRIYVGGAGIVQCVMAGDGAVVPHTVPAGGVLDVRCKRVNSTSTTATLLVAQW